MGRHSDIDKMSREELEKDFTPEQKKLLADIRVGRKDPVFFAEGLLGIKLHDRQKIWLWMTTRTQPDQAFAVGLQCGSWKSREEFDALLERNPSFTKNLLVPSNRWGKTLVTSVKHIWYNVYKIGVRGSPADIAKVRCGTLNLSPHSNQCQAGFDYVLDILASRFIFNINGRSFKNRCRIPDFYVSHNVQKRMVMFKNGTFYKSVPTGEDQAASLAGNPYLYISYDEAAQSLHLKAELPAKIMSRLIDFGGPLDLISTPEVDKPSHQYFFHIAKLGKEGKDGWWTLVGEIWDNVFLGREEVDRTINAIKMTDPAKYRQVAYGEFITTGKKMFDALTIERMWDGFVPSPVLHEHKYLISCDWGFSDTGDPTVFYVLDFTELLDERVQKEKRKIRIAFRESIRGGSPFAVLARAKMLQREWNGAKFVHDASSMGGVIIKKMLQEMQMGEIIDFTSAGGQKQDMLFCLLVVMSANRKTEVDVENKVIDLYPDFGRLRSYYISELEEQMGNYQYNPDKGVSDKRLDQDEVMSLGMGIWWLERKFMKNPIKQINFNPLAPTVAGVIPEKEAQKMGMHTLTIPERRIL